MRTNAAEFNRAAEKHYRDDLRQSQLREALNYLREDVAESPIKADEELRALIRCGVRVQDAARLLDAIGDRVLREELSSAELESLLNLLLVFSAVEHGGSERVSTEQVVNRA